MTAPTDASASARDSPWLAWLARQVPDCQWLVCMKVHRRAGSARAEIQGIWPADATPTRAIRALAIRAALSTRPCEVVDAEPRLLAIPMTRASSAELSGTVLVLALRELDTTRRDELVALTRWAAAVPGTQALLPPIADVLARYDDARCAALALVDLLARSLTCQRVSLGRQVNGKAELLAVSGQSLIDTRRQPTRRITARLSQAIRDHQERGANSACLSSKTDDPDDSDPLRTVTSVIPIGEVRYALMLESADGTAVDEQRIEDMRAELEPVLRLLHRVESDRSWWLRLCNSPFAVSMARSWRGRTLLIAGMVLLLMLGLPVTDRVSARAVLEAEGRQVLVAPADGHLLDASVRAGDRVQQDQLMARLDDRELVQAVARWEADLARNREELSRALVERDRMELARLRADAERIEAERLAASTALERSELRAPVDALVIDGDPAQRLGAPVQAGDVLFELAMGQGFDLQLEIEEHDVAAIEAGQSVELRLAAQPDVVHAAVVDEVLPLATVEPGRTTFRVRARLQSANEALRPGMQGVARISIGRLPLIELLGQGLSRRVRALAWRAGLFA